MPRKTCPVCGREMVWRRRWAGCWNDVRFCSDACRRRRTPGPGPAPSTPTG
ncbi:MAG: DUF2256 domain-containing protein [Lysobacterales bacterium]